MVELNSSEVKFGIGWVEEEDCCGEEEEEDGGGDKVVATVVATVDGVVRGKANDDVLRKGV